MLKPRYVVSMFSVGLMVLGAGIVSSQDYPNKPIRLVTTPPGGGSDFASRLIAQGLTASSGWQVIVDNRPTQVIAAQTVSQAPPDGYTLLVGGSSFWLGPLFEKTPYDPVKDFSPITLATIAANLLVVHPSLPVKSVKELIALAKSKPGVLNYASGPIGGATHIAAELFKYMADVNIVRIPYRGAGPALTSVVSGEILLMFSPAAASRAYVKSGRLRALAVTSAKPSALAPGLPTVAASGLTGYEVVGADVIFAPPKTSDTIIIRMNQEIVRVLKTSEAKEAFFNNGTEIVGSSPEELANKMKSEMATLVKIFKNFN